MKHWMPICLTLVSALFLRAQEPTLNHHEEQLGDPPLRAGAVLAPSAKSHALTFTNVLRITNRETARQFYNLVFMASEGVPMQWSGSYAGSGTPGTNSTEYLNAVLRRVNYYRAMAGIPAWVTFSNEYSRKAQAAALMMGGNNKLDHFPTNTWSYYTEEGAEAARNSNLSLGNAGPQAVMSQIRDNGANNTVVGHRRWILYPQTRVMGSGNVPATGTNNSSGVLWVFDDYYGSPRPATRETYIAWPPPGYVPYQVTYARWSFSYPGANFSGTTVSMTSNGVPLTVALEPVADGYGDNTLVWIPAQLNANTLPNYPRPHADTVYRVTLNNVVIGGQVRTFTYDVMVFDPSVPGADYFPPMLSGPTNPAVNVSNSYTFTAVSNASSYEVRRSQLTNGVFVDGAESGLGNFTVDAATNLYNVRDSAVKFAGTYAFHLTHTQAVDQTLTLNRTFLVATNCAVRFHSRLGWASTNQFARIQVSMDGTSWADIYSQPGTGNSGEGSFTLRTASLSAFAGRTVRLRMNYDYEPVGFGSYFPQATTGVGWYVDNFTVTNAFEVLGSAIGSADANRTFTFAPTNSGAYLLEVRPLLFGDYASEWGPGLVVNAVSNTTASVRITGLSRGPGNTWHIDFQVLSGAPGGFEPWSAPTVPGTFTRELSATVQSTGANRYRATVTSSATSKFFQIKPL
jgi:hypothetical protein